MTLTGATPANPRARAPALDRSMQRPLTYGPRSVIVTVTAWPFFLLVTLTLEPKGSDLCAAVMTLSSRGMPLAVLVPRCDASPTAYTDATQSSARPGMLSKQNTSAAINPRMRDPRFNWPDTPRGELKVAASQQNACCKTTIVADQTCSGCVGSRTSFS